MESRSEEGVNSNTDIEKLLNEIFYTLHNHHPNCTSLISDDMLRETIVAKWPLEDGVAKIPVHFFEPVRYWILDEYLAFAYALRFQVFPIVPQGEYKEIAKNFIRYALKNWSEATNNTIQFIEDDNVLSKGIHFYLTSTYSLDRMDAGAFTVRSIDNNGLLEQALVFYPDDRTFWNITTCTFSNGNRYAINTHKAAYFINTVFHEIGHALGLNHLHQYSLIQMALKNTTDGVFCSVMPYVKEITSPISGCFDIPIGNSTAIENCEPPYAVFPGQLDQRMIYLAYEKDMLATVSLKERNLDYYLFNPIYSFCSSLTISTSHKALFELFSHLALYPNQPLLSKKKSFFISDAALLGALIYMGIPAWTLALYSITSATKYLPDNMTNQLPESLKKVLASKYSIYTLNLALAYLEGKKFVPLVLTSLASVLGSYLDCLSIPLGRGTARFLNLIPQAITARCYPVNEETENVNDIENPSSEDEIIVHGGLRRLPLSDSQIDDDYTSDNTNLENNDQYVLNHAFDAISVETNPLIEEDLFITPSTADHDDSLGDIEENLDIQPLIESNNNMFSKTANNSVSTSVFAFFTSLYRNRSSQEATFDRKYNV